MDNKDEYIEGLNSELKEWSGQIDLLTAKTAKSAGMLKLKYVQELNALRAKQLKADEKMKELIETSGDAWWVVKETSVKIWEDLRVGMASATSKFN